MRFSSPRRNDLRDSRDVGISEEDNDATGKHNGNVSARFTLARTAYSGQSRAKLDERLSGLFNSSAPPTSFAFRVEKNATNRPLAAPLARHTSALITPANAALSGTSHTPNRSRSINTTLSSTIKWIRYVSSAPRSLPKLTRRFQDGRPIYIERLGKLDVGKLYALTTQERQLQHLVAEYEKFLRDRLPACSDAAGHLVETSCTIMDLHNVGLSSFYRVKDYVSAASAIGQNYCECHRC